MAGPLNPAKAAAHRQRRRPANDRHDTDREASPRTPPRGARLAARLVRGALRCGALLARRALLLAALLALVFAAVELLPGDAADATSGHGESAAEIAERRALLGLDRPVTERFLDWMTALPTGDFGTSARGEPVRALLSGPFPNTLLLGGLALLLTVLVSVALGCWAALRPHGAVDRTISATATAVLALPEFVVAVGLVLVLALWTDLLPAVTTANAEGRPASWEMLVLPVLALSIPQIGWNTRIVRAALADEAKAPHVETAVLDGLPARRVLTRHVLPGALPAIAAGAATSTGMLLGGAVVVETVFNYPGVGGVLASAVTDRDTPVIAAVVMLTGAVISGVLLIADLIRDRAAGGRL
ncbi:ABC transporter permease [Streptomyces sp. LX-29]|uniref:ABC transporter permease n=1 Tax=Streptomyces sp. LX-29 TaxID=2900152 RepID=UPI00240E0438|nr:ABC transporter permease [Streptomyces sp. LX-29]WFB10901.1 ABC transporter permease [Streptomyces sp. LX-29]